MATLSPADLLKRDNVTVFIERLYKGGSFQLRNDTSPLYAATGKAQMKFNGKIISFTPTNKLNVETLTNFLQQKKPSDSLTIELKTKGFNSINLLFKDKDFGGVAGKASGRGSERQEEGLILAINNAAKQSNDIFISSLGRDHKLKTAYKKTGLSSIRQEPYIDIYIETQRGKKFGVSCKGESAPSLAGGGLGGLNVIVPDLMNRLYNGLSQTLKNNFSLKEGSVVPANMVPDLYAEIPKENVKSILKGNVKMGGPIDFMYIGKMDVSSEVKQKELMLNGNFYSISEYMKKVPNFYFRVRKRDVEPSGNIEITFNRKNKEGFPILFSGPSTGKNNLRIVIVDNLPANGRIFQLR